MIDFDQRLQRLKDRRQGTKEQVINEALEHFNERTAVAALTGRDPRKSEAFEILKESNGVKYAIGAMAPVEKTSTDVSIREGNRVADSLISSLGAKGITVEKRLQGSVALDIHIKGHSDVDMLIINKTPISIETPWVNPKGYFPARDERPLVEIVKEIRIESEDILRKNFPATEVNTSGNKSIAMSEGSLARKVDIVPSCWHDSIKYQTSRQPHDRGIKIYHKQDHKLMLNYPFTHIKEVNVKDEKYDGNLKCVIRFLKNMIADMPDHKKSVAKKLTSYDLAAIAFHMNDQLAGPVYMRLGLVEKTRAHLNLLLAVDSYRLSLSVPDGTRKIFDATEKDEALEVLEKECSALAAAIAKDIKPTNIYPKTRDLLEKYVFL
jgi:hypothetical protein